MDPEYVRLVNMGVEREMDGRTEQDSRRTRGLKSACLTGAFSANQRKPSNRDDLLIVGQAHV